MTTSQFRRRSVWIAVLGLAAVAMAGTIASAETLVYDFYINTASPTWPGASVPHFDPSLGSLQSVTVTVDYADFGGGDCMFQNENPDVGGTVSVTKIVDWSLSGRGFWLNGSLSSSGSGFVAPSEDYSECWYWFNPYFEDIGPLSETITSDLDDLYDGPGDIYLDFFVDWNTDWTLSPGLYGGSWNMHGVDGRAGGTLTYTFAPVPEPSTLALLGVGAVSLVAFAWRRRRQPA